MPIFISHAFGSRADFDNVADALARDGVPYWDPLTVKAGVPLREQLREAVARCPACVFVATHASVKSEWCGAELGAFWGAGKPIVVYVADGSLDDGDLPPIVQGDVWERRLVRVVARARELLAEATTTAAATAPGSEPDPARPIGQLTVDQLRKLITGALSLAAAQQKDRADVDRFDGVGQAAHGVAEQVLAGFQATESIGGAAADEWRHEVLWVDDHPDNNRLERRSMEAMGIGFTLARSTREALDLLASRRFAAVISDMGRREGPHEGLVLVDGIRARDRDTPILLYTSPRAVAMREEALRRGAQLVTDVADRLVQAVVQAVGAGLPSRRP